MSQAWINHKVDYAKCPSAVGYENKKLEKEALEGQK
jgi:hypothetical protein